MLHTKLHYVKLKGHPLGSTFAATQVHFITTPVPLSKVHQSSFHSFWSTSPGMFSPLLVDLAILSILCPSGLGYINVLTDFYYENGGVGTRLSALKVKSLITGHIFWAIHVSSILTAIGYLTVSNATANNAKKMSFMKHCHVMERVLKPFKSEMM